MASYQALCKSRLHSLSKRYGLMPLNYKILILPKAPPHEPSANFHVSVYPTTSHSSFWPSLSFWFPHIVPSWTFTQTSKDKLFGSSWHRCSLQHLHSTKQTLLEKFTTGMPFPLKELRNGSFWKTGQKNKYICCFLEIFTIKQRFPFRWNVWKVRC